MYKRFDKLTGVLRDAEYQYACTTIPGINHSSTGPFQIRIVGLPNSKQKTLFHGDFLLDFIHFFY